MISVMKKLFALKLSILVVTLKTIHLAANGIDS